MDGVCLEDVRRAYEAQDPSLPDLVIALAQSPDPPSKQPVREGALTYQNFLYEVRSWSFRWKSEEEQRLYREASWKELESSEAESVLPDRLWLHEIVWALWQSEGAYERECLLAIIAKCPIKWGPWRAIKRIFKEAERTDDTEILGAIAVRLDMTNAGYFYSNEVSRATLYYLVRRAWRYLRRKGHTFPAAYADAAVDFLRFYTEDTTWRGTWIANHIFYHETDRYGQTTFNFWYPPDDLIGDRAFAEAWQRTPRPLFSLLERAQAEKVRKFAVDALKTDFRTVLREVEASWVARLANVESASVHEFVVWLLKNVPKFEEASFRQMGLHEPVLMLLESPSNEARGYAASYARTHARDLPLDDLIRLVNNDNTEVRKLAFDLLRELDPREGVGLDWWGRMLGTQYGHDVAVEVLRKHFGANELTASWFKERLLSDSGKVVDFAKEQLPKTHNVKSLGESYFTSLFDDERLQSKAAGFALYTLLEQFDVSIIDVDFWRRSILHNLSSSTIQRWIGEEKLSAKAFGVEYWKSLAYHPSWEADEWVKALKESDRAWAKDLDFDYSLGDFARKMLGDTRQFTPQEVGFDWLMELVDRLESQYQSFAENYMLTSLKPADFAPDGSSEPTMAGSEHIWQLATVSTDDLTPMQTFAVKYVRQHHPLLGPELLNRTIDSVMLIPFEFFTFERIRPLFEEDNNRLRKLAIELAHWDLARWAPPMDALVDLVESGKRDVTNFFEKAFLAEDKKENERFRLSRDLLSVEGVYRFCESLNKQTRRLGMALISKYSDLAVPSELFRLTESPDRQMRAFVIRTLWGLYRERGITMGWTPTPVDKQYTKSKKKTTEFFETGPGPKPRPEGIPVSEDVLMEFLRRELFGIPPAKLSKSEASADEEAQQQEGQRRRVKPVPARKAKLALIEVVRDLAVDDSGFAKYVSPLLLEFMNSRGKSERDACLVALTRVNRAHPELQVWSQQEER